MADQTSADTPTLSAIPSGVTSEVATPASMPPMDDEVREKSIKVSLADLTAKANAQYAQKNYENAAEIFAQAAEMQAEFNGEMSSENADILFLYGRSLFKVGQSKSDVLGGKTGGEKKKPANGAAKSKKEETAPSSSKPMEEAKTTADEIAEEKVTIVAKNSSGGSELKEADEVPDAKKPLFQFTGDENFEDSDEEEAEGEGEAEGEEEEEDDLAVAFEILDLARVLFQKRLEDETEKAEGKGKEKAEKDTPELRHIKERLADTHDLLAEISLENEKYPTAINDSRASLNYKLELYPQESEIVAEAHFKLSLALEFASVTTSDEDSKEGPKAVDQDMRDEAASELEKAIASTKMKLQASEVDLALIHAPEENEHTRKQISEVKDIIADMEQRLVDLRKPPMDVDSMLGAANPMSGILGAALGESAAETQARVEEAKKHAHDLSGLVRKKEKKPEPATSAPAPAAVPETNGKRKAEEPAEGHDTDTKKHKAEEKPAAAAAAS